MQSNVKRISGPGAVLQFPSRRPSGTSARPGCRPMSTPSAGGVLRSRRAHSSQPLPASPLASGPRVNSRDQQTTIVGIIGNCGHAKSLPVQGFRRSLPIRRSRRSGRALCRPEGAPVREPGLRSRSRASGGVVSWHTAYVVKLPPKGSLKGVSQMRGRRRRAFAVSSFEYLAQPTSAAPCGALLLPARANIDRYVADYMSLVGPVRLQTVMAGWGPSTTIRAQISS